LEIRQNKVWARYGVVCGAVIDREYEREEAKSDAAGECWFASNPFKVDDDQWFYAASVIEFPVES
jgi:hypothetical protein